MQTLRATLESLAEAAQQCQQSCGLMLALVNNDPQPSTSEPLWELLASPKLSIFDQRLLLNNQGNVGYGMGHNRLLRYPWADFHLVLNPDVILSSDALEKALSFMKQHPDVGLLAPQTLDERGNLQYLCKRHPSVLALLLRGFAPSWLRRRCSGLLHYYEMRELIGTATIVWDIPIVSGCFMFLRTTAIQQVEGFAPRFFMYFEDFDLSLRIGRVQRTVYVPTVKITHLGGQAARKGWRHVRWFIASMIRFFNCHGWRWY